MFKHSTDTDNFCKKCNRVVENGICPEHGVKYTSRKVDYEKESSPTTNQKDDSNKQANS